MEITESDQETIRKDAKTEKRDITKCSQNLATELVEFDGTLGVIST